MIFAPSGTVTVAAGPTAVINTLVNDHGLMGEKSNAIGIKHTDIDEATGAVGTLTSDLASAAV